MIVACSIALMLTGAADHRIVTKNSEPSPAYPPLWPRRCVELKLDAYDGGVDEVLDISAFPHSRIARLGAQPALPSSDAPPATIAAALLDDTRDQKAREQLARDAAPRAAAVVLALVEGLPEDEVEEYRRIPWIWRVAVAAGRAKDEPALQQLLDASMPPRGGRLRDWQSVVLGGGVVMGLSQAGAWPADVMAPWLAADAGRAARWQHALTGALAMSDDGKVRNGTRYDALRMIAVLPWDRAGATLVRYLSTDVDAELQMGAIGGLSDLQDDRATDAIVRHFPAYTETNRRHAINALLRSDARRARLREAIARGIVKDEWLTPEQRQRLSAGPPPGR